MAQPGNVFSTNAHLSEYVAPYDRYKPDLEDFEEGGIALNDGTQGLRVQMWHLAYDDDEESATYGDFTVRAETTGETAVIINVPDVVRVGLAFDQNMNPFICYQQKDCTAWFYWWDPVPNDYVTVQLPAGAKHPACCLDDHRQTQTGTSSILLGYILSGNLEYRHQADRFQAVQDSEAVGAGVLHKVGMQKNMCIKWDVREGRGVRLSEIVGDILTLVGMKADQFDVSELYPIEVRGYISAGQYEAADTIRALQQTYFWDFPLIDGKLAAVRRGGEIEATITLDDLVADREFRYETAREQGVEFSGKMHCVWAAAETDYTATTVTSERRSPDFDGSHSESTAQSAVNHTTQDAMERLSILHKIAWTEFTGRAVFSITERFAHLVPSSLINLEVRPGEFKRLRITRALRTDGVFDCKAVRDRQSSYTAGSITLPVVVPPEAPPPTIPGDTTWAFMDVPVLDGSDTLHYYVAGRGDPGTAWHGYRVQRLVGADWETEVDVGYAELMGALEEALPYASGDFIDTTNSLLLSLSGTPAGVTEDLMLQGRGAWLLISGSTLEIVQVRDWAAEGGDWRGSYLFRGRLDTVAATHAIGTRAVFLGNPVRVPVNGALLDTSLQLRAPSFGQAFGDAADAAYAFSGRSQEEWPPVLLEAVRDVLYTNDWDFSWTPRWRLGSSAAPMPSAHFYGWRLRFTVGPITVAHDTAGPNPAYTYTAADQVADFGSVQAGFDAVEICALNYLGGEGKALTEAVP